MAKKSLGTNVQYEVSGNILTLTVDLSKESGPSASGKTITIASTQGNKEVGDARVGLNVYRYPEPKTAKAKK